MASIEHRKIGKNNNENRYRVKIRLKGYPVQTATFKRLTDARKWAQETESDIRNGRYFKTSEAKKHSLSDAIERYIKYVLPTKPKSIKDQYTQLNWWKSSIGNHSLADVTPALIAEYRDKLSQGITPKGNKRSNATVNRYLAALSHLFTVAVKEWGWVQENPLTKVSKLKEPRGRVRYLSNEERELLIEAAKKSKNSYLYLVIVLCLSTGARKMEIMNLTWGDVDLERQMITLHETKNGERRVLAIRGLALKLLKEHANLRHLHTNLLFPSNKRKKPIDIRSSWETALKEAEIKDFRFHDLRHSAASYLAMNGASLAEIAAVLGHKTLTMVKRYAHLSEAHTAQVVASMNEKIFGNLHKENNNESITA